MRLSCPSCGQEISAQNIDLKNLVGKCERCNEVFSVMDQVLDKGIEALAKPPIEMPKGFSIEHRGGGLLISHRLRSVAPFLLLAMWALISYAGGAAPPHRGSRPNYMLWATLAGIAYFGLVRYINRSEVEVNDGTITSRFVPFPLPGRRPSRTPISEIVQLFTKERVVRNRRSTDLYYDVVIVTRANKQIRLIKDLEKLEHAQFFEQELEKYLGIKDRPVRGEAGPEPHSAV